MAALLLLAQDSPNPRGIMSSKASGEPSLMLSAGVLAALQNAVTAARTEVSGTSKVCAEMPGAVYVH
jgi:xanthine dehydrogenase molybdopterin-binding subunit B